MQMFILSPLIIWPLWRWRRAGLAWVLFVIVALVSGIMTIYIVWELPASSFRYTREYLYKKEKFFCFYSNSICLIDSAEMRNNRHYYSDYYYQMWTRSPPYLIGILLGFLLHQTKNKKILINKVHR